MRLLQVTTSASRAQLTTQNIYASVVIVSSSVAANFLGDNTVTTANGIPLPSATAFVIPISKPQGIPLNTLWVVGAAGVLNVLYEPAT